jgi:soluble lytic murein transglycosylase-like protein
VELDHLEAVKSRIEEIRRRFVDVQDTGTSVVSAAPASGQVDFKEALSRLRGSKASACPEEYEPMIDGAASRYGVDPAVIKAVIHTESGFKSGAVSRTGAKGLMQLMPGTARALGVDPTDPEQCIDGGTRYLKELQDKFGDLPKALAAYNAGPGAVVRHGGIPPYGETQRYVSQVMQRVADYSKGEKP